MKPPSGPTFVNGQFETVATYANGGPMATVQGSIGLDGCHLESQVNWHTKKYMQPQWHANTHHIFAGAICGRLFDAIAADTFV